MKVGVLALQGDVREHVRALEQSDAAAVPVKNATTLADVDAIVLPGGESTTIGKLMRRFDLLEPLRERIASGMPVYGTCAGLILLATDIAGRDPAPDRLALMDVTVRRNGYGRQLDSFETDLDVDGLDSAFRAVFIRAPVVERTSDAVEVLARVDGEPALVRQGHMLGSTFHPEMTPDVRIHEMFVALARKAV